MVPGLERLEPGHIYGEREIAVAHAERAFRIDPAHVDNMPADQGFAIDRQPGGGHGRMTGGQGRQEQNPGARKGQNLHG